MAPIIKSQEEREKIRETGRIVASLLAELRIAVRPGITTDEIDHLAVESLQRYGAKSSSLGYHGYPKSLCTSVNDEIVHGIPGARVLHEGDTVTLDFAAVYNGWHADSAITVPVGKVSADVERVLKVTVDALYRGIAAARAGNRIHDISRVVQQFVEAAGFSIVRRYGGPGVGRRMHESPPVPHSLEPAHPPLIFKPSPVIPISPILNITPHETRVLADNWTV